MKATKPILYLAVMTMAAFLGGLPATAVVPEGAGAAGRTDDVDQLIVRYRQDPSDAQLRTRIAVAQQAGAVRGVGLSHKRRGALGTHVLQLSKHLSVADARQLARDLTALDPNIEYAEPDLRMWPALVPNDPQYNQQWHYFEATGGINLPLAWDRATGNGVRVAVIDTGYRPHTDLAANIIGGYDFISNAADARDGSGRDSDAQDQGDWRTSSDCNFAGASNSTWHGTHVAGTVAARTNNSTGVAGVAYNARIVPVRVLGRCGGTVSDIADAIVWASGGTVSGVPANPHAARVLNLSLSAVTAGACSTTYQNAINSARSRNSVVVVAAGNHWSNANYQPGNCAGVITVAATSRAGGRAYYSNFGPAVEIAAPGGETNVLPANGVLSTLNSGTTTPLADNYMYYQGTSMATPHVSGVVAMMLELAPSLTPDQVLGHLQATARAFPASCSGCGAGILNARAALDAAAPPPGGGGNTISISDVSLEGSWGTYSNQAVYQLASTGDIVASAVSCNPSCGSLGSWISPKSNFSSYQARAINNGCVYTGWVSLLFNTWYNLSVSPQWGSSISSIEPGTVSEFCTMTIQISAVSNPSVILDSATVTINIWTGP